MAEHEEDRQTPRKRLSSALEWLNDAERRIFQGAPCLPMSRASRSKIFACRVRSLARRSFAPKIEGYETP